MAGVDESWRPADVRGRKLDEALPLKKQSLGIAQHRLLQDQDIYTLVFFYYILIQDMFDHVLE